MTSLIRNFISNDPCRVQDIGGKGMQLCDLACLRFNVPTGIVVTTSAIREIWKTNPNLLTEATSLMELWCESSADKFAISRRLPLIPMECLIPESLAIEIAAKLEALPGERFAVRSSACNEDGSNSSFAGIFESFLNISKCDTLVAISKCMSSQLSYRSLEYHAAQGQRPSITDFAVIIQQQIEAEVSGVCFTSTDSLQGPNNQIIIEAVYGVGESLVGGEVSPDRYTVSGAGKVIVQKEIGFQRKQKATSPYGGTGWVSVDDAKARMQKLSDRMILELASVCLDIASMQGHACDVEWCVYDGRIFVLQARPITTAITL